MTECKKGEKLEDCELNILRHQVDEAQNKLKRRVVNTPEVKAMISIVEEFIKSKGLVAYGGISIDSLLPEEDKIYDPDIDLPDYDFFSPNAMDDAKELADIFYQKGYKETEAKSGQHLGTYKVFVNFQGMADVTQLPPELFKMIKSKAIMVDGIYYTDPNFLRMSMYLELSRPAGDTSRWEKVLKRLALINKHYPIDQKCDYLNFQRKMEDTEKGTEIFEIVKNSFINQGVVFFGGYAISQYSQYMPESLRKQVEKNADFDVLANNPERTAEIVKERLEDGGVKDIKIIKREPVGEIIPVHYELRVNDETIAFIYKTVGCHSYNVLMQGKDKIKIATIDTMLNFYLAFLYADRDYFQNNESHLNADRILCMSKFLFEVQQKNRLEQKGLLKRFSITCYGHQESREDMRAEKTKAFEELKNKRDSREFQEHFLNYRPGSGSNEKEVKSFKKSKRRRNKPKKGPVFSFFQPFQNKKTRKHRKKYHK